MSRSRGWGTLVTPLLLRVRAREIRGGSRERWVIIRGAGRVDLNDEAPRLSRSAPGPVVTTTHERSGGKMADGDVSAQSVHTRSVREACARTNRVGSRCRQRQHGGVISNRGAAVARHPEFRTNRGDAYQVDQGKRIEGNRLPRTRAGPVMVTIGAYGNNGNFVVIMSGPSGRELLVNEIGFYAGTVLYPYARPGSYKVAVQADGSWSGRIDRPIANPRAKSLLGRHSSRGDDVVSVRLAAAAEPTLGASCRCRGNFAVLLRDYRGGSELLINEIGRYSAQVLAPRLAAGNYLVEVIADGQWSLRFSR
jgi:hypothetical protein